MSKENYRTRINIFNLLAMKNNNNNNQKRSLGRKAKAKNLAGTLITIPTMFSIVRTHVDIIASSEITSTLSVTAAKIIRQRPHTPCLSVIAYAPQND